MHNICITYAASQGGFLGFLIPMLYIIYKCIMAVFSNIQGFQKVPSLKDGFDSRARYQVFTLDKQLKTKLLLRFPTTLKHSRFDTCRHEGKQIEPAGNGEGRRCHRKDLAVHPPSFSLATP